MSEKRSDHDKLADRFAPPRRFRGIRSRVNTFLLTAVIGFAGLLGLIAYKQGMFLQHTNVYFHAPDATGINKGTAVRLHGVPVGSVRDIELAERGVRVRMGINSEYISRLPRGAQARLTREGYVGAASIQILPGTSTTDRSAVAEGDEIRFIAQKGMADMLDEVRQQLTPAFAELRKVASEMADPNSDFRRSVSALRTTLEELPPATRELRELVREADSTMVTLGRQAESVGSRGEAALEAVARIGAQASEHLPVLAAKLAGTLDSLDAAAAEVRETARANGDALHELLTQAPELMRGSGELVRDTRDLTAAARRSWLLRDYVEPSQMRTLPVDSFESFGKR
ncbi:MAG TPA: MlaD family protein [Burkholderiales bacterium]|nr:MlaD family protein [Burkholderiales bacterium]